MAKKVVNRKKLRAESDAAEASESKKKTKAPAKKKAPAKRRAKSKDPDDIRVRIYWGVYNQSMKRIAKYDFNLKKAAQKRAEELTAEGKPHFVQKDKEPIDEV